MHQRKSREKPNSKSEITNPADFNDFNCSKSHDLLSNQKFHDRKCLRCFSSLQLLRLSVLCIKTIKLPRVLALLCLPSVYFYSSSYHKCLYLYLFVLIVAVNFAFFHLIVAPILGISNKSTPIVWWIGPVKRDASGDVYEGEVYGGKFSGYGVYQYDMKGTYEGEWVNDKFDGFGVETWSRGDKYRGHFRQGLKEGLGVYMNRTGDIYGGEWYMGQCHGYGVYTRADGSKYTGEFKTGIMHGVGLYNFRNGDMYAGEYFSGIIHGFGVYHFANGHRYEGSWHEGKQHGFGLYTHRNGDTQSGCWKDGVLSINPVSHAKLLKAVEEARRLAKKAVASRNVEEKANRAMTAAYMAANAARVAAVKAVQSHVYYYAPDPVVVIV